MVSKDDFPMQERDSYGRRRRTHGRVLAALVVAVGLTALAGCSRGGNGQRGNAAAANARAAVMTVTASPLERSELSRKIGMNGSVYAWQEVIIAPEVGG